MRKLICMLFVLVAGWAGATMVKWDGPEIKAPSPSEKEQRWVSITFTLNKTGLANVLANASGKKQVDIFKMIGDGSPMNPSRPDGKKYEQGIRVQGISSDKLKVSGHGQGGEWLHVASGAYKNLTTFKVWGYGSETFHVTTDLGDPALRKFNYIAGNQFEIKYDPTCFTKIELTDIDGKTYSVPEPTILALLALGIAGIALRRRAA